MATLIKDHVQAYVNHGRWVAECGRPYCGNAFKLDRNEMLYVCRGDGGCGFAAVVEWPSNADEIWEALMQRPVPATRNWIPFGHKLAERFGLPAGQTPRELLEEQAEMEKLSP